MEPANSSVMVCLISRQTMQNLLPILQYRPQQVVCITTREEDNSRKHLEAVLHTRQLLADTPLYVDAYAPDTTLRACRQLITRYGVAFHRLHGSPAGAVAVFDPRLGAVVVASHTPGFKEGQVLELSPGDGTQE